jgi:hypothetical protein
MVPRVHCVAPCLCGVWSNVRAWPRSLHPVFDSGRLGGMPAVLLLMRGNGRDSAMRRNEDCNLTPPLPRRGGGAVPRTPGRERLEAVVREAVFRYQL